MNSIIITGKLGADPQVRSARNGRRFITFSVAVEVGYGDSRETVWWSCSSWEKDDPFTFLERFGKKGQSVAVTGKDIRPKVFRDRSGRTRVDLSMRALSVDSIAPRSKKNAQSRANGQGSRYYDGDDPFYDMR